MPFTKIQALEWALQVASGMSYLHSRGFVHRDIKPQNILLNKSNDALVADLGTVRSIAGRSLASKPIVTSLPALRNFADNPRIGSNTWPRNKPKIEDVESGGTTDTTDTTDMTVAGGTPMFMAPEQASATNYGYPVDVWAFGLTLVCLFTLEDPYSKDFKFSNDILKGVIAGTLRPYTVTLADVPHSDVVDVINECLQYEPDKRPTFKVVEKRLHNALKTCKKEQEEQEEKEEIQRSEKDGERKGGEEWSSRQTGRTEADDALDSELRKSLSVLGNLRAPDGKNTRVRTRRFSAAV